MTRFELLLPRSFADEPVLRQPLPEDVDRITELCRDPAIQRFTRVPVPYTRHDATSFVEAAAEAISRGRGAHLVVVRDGTVVGAVGIDIDPYDGVGSVGYWTAPDARRQGITTASVRRVCRWALGDVGVPRLELTAAASNAASNAIAAALGFTHEGTRRRALLLSAVGDLPAERVDGEVWGLLPGELT